MTRVLSTQEFDTWERLLPRDYQDQVRKIIDQLKVNFGVGKPLGYSYFREKRVGPYRMYYLVYEKQDTVLLVTMSDKKMQQEVIDQIKNDLPKYYKLIENQL